MVQDKYQGVGPVWLYIQANCMLVKRNEKVNKNKERESRRSLNEGLREEEINKAQRETLVKAISRSQSCFGERKRTELLVIFY